MFERDNPAAHAPIALPFRSPQPLFSRPACATSSLSSIRRVGAFTTNMPLIDAHGMGGGGTGSSGELSWLDTVAARTQARLPLVAVTIDTRPTREAGLPTRNAAMATG